MDTRKKNKDRYKNMEFKKGIFRITNLKSGKIYLQKSLDLERGYNSDVFQLKSGLHSNKQLQNDWTKDGVNNFKIDILDELKVRSDATDNKINEELDALLKMHKEEMLRSNLRLYNYE